MIPTASFSWNVSNFFYLAYDVQWSQTFQEFHGMHTQVSGIFFQ